MPTFFDPEAWHRLCEHDDGIGFVFRRSAELAVELARPWLRPGQRWLDIGCGTGRVVRVLRESGVLAIGADFDPRMIQFARQTVSAPMTVARAEQLPFGDATLDGVIATSLMGCVAEASPVFAELRRVLRPGGHAVISFTLRDSWLLKLNYVLSRRREGGYRLYTVEEVVHALEGNGFQILTVRFYNFVFGVGNGLLPPASLARRLESSRSYRLARNFMVVAHRFEQL